MKRFFRALGAVLGSFAFGACFFAPLAGPLWTYLCFVLLLAGGLLQGEDGA